MTAVVRDPMQRVKKINEVYRGRRACREVRNILFARTV